MRKSIFYSLFACMFLFAGAITISSCGSNQKSETEEPAAEEESTAVEETSSEEQVAYACPMHPEETGKEGDKCSKCGMDLEPVSEEPADSTAHDHDHE